MFLSCKNAISITNVKDYRIQTTLESSLRSSSKLLSSIENGCTSPLSQNEFIDFLKKNGFDEFEEVLTKEEITDGEKFLNLHELQIIKWRLPPATKKKLFSFLTEVKQNPEKFIGKTEIDKRLRSVKNTETNIKDKLDEVAKSTKNEIIEESISSPVDMENPLSTQLSVVTDNDHELHPSNENMTNLHSLLHKSTDEAENQDTSPPLFPRDQKKPCSTPPRQISVVVHNGDEKPIDDSKEDVDSGRSSSELCNSPFGSLRTTLHDDEENEHHDRFMFSPTDEPFFRNTDRRGAQMLLLDLEDGAFLFRPSDKFFLILSLVCNKRCFHLVVQKTENNKIRLSTDDGSMSPEFTTISEFITYFTREPLTFQYQGRIMDTYLRTILPPDKF